MIIKNADFSSVSIGKVNKDLSFELCGNTTDGVSGFPNWNPDTSTVVSARMYKIDESGETPIVYLPTFGGGERLQSDYIEVSEGMIIFPNDSWPSILNPSGSTTINTSLACFDEDKNLLTDASLYSVYRKYEDSSNTSRGAGAPFTVPAGVKYIIIQTLLTSSSGKNIIRGIMPVV